MARETKVVQSHPDKEMQTINFYQRFGWEVIANQRCQEDEKRGETWYTITFNKITFSREKGEPWYNRVCELERQAEYLDKKGISAIDGKAHGLAKPIPPKKVDYPTLAKKGGFITGLIIFLIFVGLMLLNINPEIADEIGPMSGFIFIGVIVGAIIMISNIKNLKGLSGKAAQQAIEKYNQYKNEYSIYENKYNKYEKELIKLFNAEIDKINAELEEIFK